jgi:large conductance mechanosensitive channel
MLKGFKEFLLRGNVIELAVAFVMAQAFGAVVTATVAVLMDVVGKAGGTPEFSSFAPGGIHIGTPYTKATERLDAPKETTQPEDIALLTEIRDLLAQRTS